MWQLTVNSFANINLLTYLLTYLLGYPPVFGCPFTEFLSFLPTNRLCHSVAGRHHQRAIRLRWLKVESAAVGPRNVTWGSSRLSPHPCRPRNISRVSSRLLPRLCRLLHLEIPSRRRSGSTTATTRVNSTDTRSTYLSTRTSIRVRRTPEA